MSPAPRLTLDTLRAEIEDGTIDTVIVAFTDMQGRLQGKRLHGHFFLDHVLAHGTEGCNYLLAVDVEMNTVDGYAISSWERGYGDMVFDLDLTTLRRTPGAPHSATIQCDLSWTDGGGPVRQSPRAVLREQVDRAAQRGLVPYCGTELEFIVFEDSYDAAWDRGYTGMTPANRYNVDYSILGGDRVEPLLREIRNEMYRAGAMVEGAKGECNLGQHEISFLFDEAIRTCDTHVIYRNAAKEIAARMGKSITFMAKYDQREGSSCHIHLSLRGEDGSMSFADESRPYGHSELFDHFMAGILATMRDLTYFYAPNINSYKRFQEGSFAPTAVAWGRDNRTCALRVVGHGSSLRVENRVPGGDVNPYLAVAAMLAGGLHGITERLPLPEPLTGNAYTSDLERVPTTLREARDRLQASELARKLLGDDVVEHYVNAADVELAAFDSAVTDWERRRGFERL